MDSGKPRAIIIGSGGELEEKLVERLVKNDIGVEKFSLGVGGGEYKYVFVFPGEEGWEKIGWGSGAKVTQIETEWDGGGGNRFEGETESRENKKVKLHNLYGPGVVEEWWGKRALEMAAANNNLELPEAGKEARWLYVDDGVEAILRATILGEIGEGKLEIWGEKTQISELAGELMDKAQMTKFKVKQVAIEIGEEEDEKVETEWERIRWKPETPIGEGLAETMQYFVSRWDELSRIKKETASVVLPPKKKREAGWGLAVEIEEAESQGDSGLIGGYGLGENGGNSLAGEVEVNNEPEPAEAENRPTTSIGVGTETKEETEDQNYWTKSKEEEMAGASEWLNLKRKKIEEELDEEAEEEILEEERGEVGGKLTTEKPEVSQRAVDRREPELAAGANDMAGEKKVKTRIKWPKLKLNLKGQWKKNNWYWVIIVLGVAWVVADLWGWLGPMVASVGGVEKGIKNGGWSEEEVAEVEKDKQKLAKKLNQWGSSWWAATTWGKRYGEVGGVLVEAVDALVAAQMMARSGEKMMGAMWGESDLEWSTEMERMKKYWGEWQEDSGKLLARLRGDWRWLPQDWEDRVKKTAVELGVKRKLSEKMGGILEVLPSMVAAEGGRREYLVLFQNEAELRPTGGFIGSWALVSFEGGRLINFEVRDVYEGDGQLKGHVEPPEPIKTHLGEAGWFLRDANWNPDFRKSATDIGWFLEKETGRVVDGIVGVDLAVAKEILGVMGELKLPGFDTKINSDNLYEQAQFYAENKFFPGSKQKANFLGELGNQLFEDIKTAKGHKKWLIGEKLVTLAEKREIQIWLRDTEAAGVMGQLGWDGAMFGGECKNERCLADYLMPVDANLGVNKANFFVKRKVEVGVEVGNNLVARVVRINWENTSRSSSWPGGDYKNYLRVYLPTGINLSSVVLSDGKTGQTVKTYSGSELKVETSGGKTILGMLLMVPIASSRVLELRYSSPTNLGSGDNFSYLMYAQKQSGWGDTGLVAVVNLPEGWQPLQAEPAATSVGQKLLFNLRWDRDIKMGVEMGR